MRVRIGAVAIGTRGRVAVATSLGRTMDAVHILTVLVLVATAAFLGLRQFRQRSLDFMWTAGVASSAVLITVDGLRQIPGIDVKRNGCPVGQLLGERWVPVALKAVILIQIPSRRRWISRKFRAGSGSRRAGGRH